VAVSGHRHLDNVGCELSEALPPRRREAAGGCALTVAPYGDSDAGCVGERSIVDEVDGAAAPNPATGRHPSLHGFEAQPRASGLSERDDTVVAAQIVVEYVDLTLARDSSFHTR
jgi:hypothetical protein